MKIEVDRILVDLLNWVRQLVWWREEEVKTRPYEKLKTWRIAGAGMLYKVSRPPELCPRDVGAYIFSPFRYGKATVSDIHICCDYLEGITRGPAGRKRAAKHLTHRITVLAADHYPRPNGLYQAEIVFMRDDDLQGSSVRRDIYVHCILHQLALATAVNVASHNSVDYLAALDSAKRHCMDYDYTRTIKPAPGAPLIIYPYAPDQDGTIKIVRVQL